VSGEGARKSALLLAAGRAALGVAVLAAPEQVSARWLGDCNSRNPVVGDLVRSLGARDLALGLLTLAALDDPVMGSRAQLLCAFVDGVDTLATIVARAALPRKGVFGTVLIATASAGGGLYLSRRLAHP
jgi:hypothetical protein